METVVAIKTKEDLSLVSKLLGKYSNTTLYQDVWNFGLNVALRISDLLSIKFSDLDVENRRLVLVEGKTGKKREITLNEGALSVINRRKQEHPEHIYLFQVDSNRAKNKPVSRISVGRKFAEVGEVIGVALGSHSMRKTRGAMMFQAGVPIEKIAKVLNHSSPSITLAYIGIEKEDIQQTYDDFVL